MIGGTYAEALKAGFNETQAAMLSRLSAETKTEVVQELNRRDIEVRNARVQKVSGRLCKLALYIGCVAAGIAIQRAFT